MLLVESNEIEYGNEDLDESRENSADMGPYDVQMEVDVEIAHLNMLEIGLLENEVQRMRRSLRMEENENSDSEHWETMENERESVSSGKLLSHMQPARFQVSLSQTHLARRQQEFYPHATMR